ncbi:MAG TPA: capsule assembly Wzi family protein [Longimicrobium sp.]|nr:capsule assembly Wzi family protein [Longimicrobium sp.]
MRVLLRPILAGAALAACVRAAPMAAQAPDLRAEVTAGSEAERYLRVLQVAGKAPLYPWGVRGFSAAEVDRLMPADTVEHPWAARAGIAAGDSNRVQSLRSRADLVYNSAFPQGTNDGAVWAGRGVTASASSGFRWRSEGLSIRFEPMVTWAQNASFRLVPNGQADSLRFRNPRSPGNLDYPQRFGDGAFAGLYPGESTIRADVEGVAVGFSTASQQWGPGADQPLLLGTNAAGFPHVYVGTTSPWNVGIGRVHGRVMWASLAESRWSPMEEGHGSRRYASGINVEFLPWGLDGLELGVARFYHQAWRYGGLVVSDLQRPLEAFFRNSLAHPDEYGVNQLASAYFRWTLPQGGAEVYGEFAREDHNFDLLDLFMEPDRSSGYMLGGRKVWGTGRRLTSLRMEWVNTQPSHLDQGSSQAPNLYGHIDRKQGHTYRGQLLGSIAGYGGGGSIVALDSYTPRGRLSVDWTRTRLRSPRRVGGEDYDVQVSHALGAEAVAFRGRMDLVARLRGTLEMNRFPGEDVFNLSAALGVRAGL